MTRSREGDLQQALDRVREHSLAAGRETIDALRAAIEVFQIMTGQDPRKATISEPGDLLRMIDGWIEHLEKERVEGIRSDWADPLFDALATEISRWEGVAASDPAALPVLYAFLGLRGFLETVGLEPSDRASAGNGSVNPDSPPPRDTGPRRAGPFSTSTSSTSTSSTSTSSKRGKRADRPRPPRRRSQPAPRP